MAERKYILTEPQLMELVDSYCNAKREIIPSGYCPYAAFGSGHQCSKAKHGCDAHSAEYWEKFREKVLKRYTKNEVSNSQT